MSACKCDNMTSFACNTDPLAPNEVLNVCIWSVSTDVEIATLNSLKLFQGDAQNNKTQVIVDGLVIATQFSSMATKSDTERFVATVVPSRFQSGGTPCLLLVFAKSTSLGPPVVSSTRPFSSVPNMNMRRE